MLQLYIIANIPFKKISSTYYSVFYDIFIPRSMFEK